MGDSLPRGGAPRKGKIVNLRIQFLDDSVHAFQVPVKALGMALWEAVIRHLQLVESDYFDLQYGDKCGLKCWLDNEKPILKQLPSPDSPLEFCVKFYTPDPGLLDEYTRYLFSLQIKKDLATGSMQCSENTAALVASYIAQAEIGDFIVEEYIDHTYLKSLNAFVPHQTDELLKKVMEYHRQHIGESPAEAESSLLDTARKVDTYGVKLCAAKDHENVSLHLSIAHVGILVFQLHTKINTFSWAKVRKLSFKRKRFLIKLHPESYGYYKDTVEFFFESRDECKIFWKKCIEHHAFFRCHTVKKVPRNKTRLVSRGSSFRYSGRTQKQLMTYVRETCVKSPAFERSVSGRISCSRSASVTPKISAKAGLHNSTTDTHNSTASSGSHILSPGLDEPTTPSRTETAEVHSVDSSLSGSRSLPSPKLDRSREGTPGAEVDLPDDDGVASPESRVDRIDERGATSTFVTNAIVSAPLDSNPNNNQNVSANQNANDNDENSQSQSFSLVKDGKVKKLDESSMDTENNLSATFPTKPHLTKDIEHVNNTVGGTTKPSVSSTDSLPSNLKHNVQDSSPEGLGTFLYQKSPNSTLGREHKKVVFADDVGSHPTPGKVSEVECKQGEVVKGKDKQEMVAKKGPMHANEEKGKSVSHEKPLRKLVQQDSGKSLSKQDSLTKKSTNLEKGGVPHKGEIISSSDRKADRKLMKQDNVINEDVPTNKDQATDKASKKPSHKEVVTDSTSRKLPQKELTTDNVSRKQPQKEVTTESLSRNLPQDITSDRTARKGSVTRESPDKKAVQQEPKKMESFGKADVTYPKRTGSIEKLQKLDLNTGSDVEKSVRTDKESEDKYKNELNKNKSGKTTGLNGGEDMIGDIPYLLHRRHLEKSPEPVKTEEVTSPTDMDDIISNRRSRSLKKKRPSNMQVHQVKVYEGSLPVVPDKGKTEIKSPVSEGNSPVSPISGGGSPCSDTSSLGSVAGSPVTPGSGVGSPVSPGSRGASPISPGSRGTSPISPGSRVGSPCNLQQRIGSRSPSGKRGYQSRSPSGKRTPSRTSNDRSPSCNRRMEIVNYHRLPHKDSFSSVDDTTSPTFEKDILKQIQNKENIKENESSFSECNGEVIKDGITLPSPLSVAKEPLSSHQASEDNKSNNNLEMAEDITVVQNKLNDNLEKRLSEDKLARKEATGLPTESKMYSLPQHITQQVQHSYRVTSDNPKSAKASNPSEVNVVQSRDDPRNIRSSNPTPVSSQPGERGKLGAYVSRPEPSKVGGVQTTVNKSSAFHMKNPDKKAKEPFSPVYRPTFSLKQSKESALSASKPEGTQPKITTTKLNTDGKDNTSVRIKPALPSKKPALPGKKPEIMSKKPALPGKRPDQQSKKTESSRKADPVSLDFSSPAAEFILSETDYASKPNRNSITFSTFKPPDSNSTSPRPLSLVSVDENEEEASISLAADKDPTVRLNQTFHAHPPENVFRPSPKSKLKLRRHPSDQSIEGSKVNEPRKFHKDRGYMYSFESVNDPPSAQMFLSGSTDTDVQGSPESVESVDMLEPLENLEENISDGSESSVSEGSNSEFGDDSEHECDSSDNDDAERQKEFLQFAKSLADSGKEITVDSGVGVDLSDSGIKDISPLDPLDQLETLEGSVYEDENQNLPPRNDNNGKRHYTNTTLSSSSDESYHERVVRNKRVSVDPLESLENPHIAELASLSGDSYSDECDSDDHTTSRHRLGDAIPILTISTASSPDDPHRSPSSSHDNEISQSNPS